MGKVEDEGHCRCGRGVTRRSFLTTVGMGTMAVMVPPGLARGDTGAAGGEPLQSDEMARTTLQVNGRRYQLLVEPRWSLLYVLRDKLGLTGTKVGCERGECGACTVLIDDLPRYACMTLAMEAEGSRITTVEGLMDGEEMGPVQQAFLEHDAFQCGYCTPGQIMAAEGLLRANPSPSREEIRRAMSGNLCRCGAYVNICKAVGRAAELKQGR